MKWFSVANIQIDMFSNLIKIVSVAKSVAPSVTTSVAKSEAKSVTKSEAKSVAKLKAKSVAKLVNKLVPKSTCLYSIFYLLINVEYLIILNNNKLQYII